MEQRELSDDFDPAYIIRWRAGIAAAYCVELKQRAAQAGLAEMPLVKEKIRLAEAYERAPLLEVQESP